MYPGNIGEDQPLLHQTLAAKAGLDGFFLNPGHLES